MEVTESTGNGVYDAGGKGRGIVQKVEVGAGNDREPHHFFPRRYPRTPRNTPLRHLCAFGGAQEPS